MLLLVGCATAPDTAEEKDACDLLADRVTECGGKAGAGFADRCRGSRAEEVDALQGASCSTLSTVDTSAWEADVSGRSSQALSSAPKNSLCVFSWQCAKGLVCRPTMSFVNRCLDPGTLGEHCWTDGQCERGLSCHWIWHDIAPAPHPGRVCNPHSENPHPHTPADR